MPIRGTATRAATRTPLTLTLSPRFGGRGDQKGPRLPERITPPRNARVQRSPVAEHRREPGGRRAAPRLRRLARRARRSGPGRADPGVGPTGPAAGRPALAPAPVPDPAVHPA